MELIRCGDRWTVAAYSNVMTSLSPACGYPQEFATQIYQQSFRFGFWYWAAGLPCSSCSSEHTAVHPRSFIIEGQWIPCRGGPLQTVLPSSAFVTAVRGMWAGG